MPAGVPVAAGVGVAVVDELLPPLQPPTRRTEPATHASAYRLRRGSGHMRKKGREIASASATVDVGATLHGRQTAAALAVVVTETCAEAVPPFGLSDEGETAHVAPVGAPEQDSVTG